MSTQNGYLAFFDRKRVEIYANDYFEAKQKAISHFKARPNKHHLITVVLVEKAGEPVLQTVA